MPAKNIQLLLLQSIENLGIVGDIVTVKPGFARNYLLPHGLAEPPTPEKIEALKEARSKAEAAMLALRAAREGLLARMESVEVSLVRSCNDQGVLYGSVTQRDIADGLQEAGYDVGVRSVRLRQSIRRIGTYPVPIQFEKDLRCEVTIQVEPDQPLEEREEMEFDDEGNLIEKPRAATPRKGDQGERVPEGAPGPAAEPAPAANAG
ncbi:MAG: 50S ribosomal protein L9 [Planctomycetota bacterium]|jgi:large subunit ribosomal protein L9